MIDALRNKKGILLKQHDRLHAKVIVGGRRALVGSANLSGNGLNLEGNEMSGWEEAGLVTTDPKQIGAIKEWFTMIWKSSRAITDAEVEDARCKWKERRATRVKNDPPNSRSGFLLKELGSEELADRPIYLTIYRDWISDEAKRACRMYEEELTGQQTSKSAKLPPMYENWPELPKEAQLIDLYYGPRGALRCYGVFTRTHDIKFTYLAGSKGHLAVCRRDDKIMGCLFGVKESQRFAEDLRPCIEKIWNSDLAVGDDGGKFIRLADVAEMLG
ncbi:phospholipase D-like domain-containing protein [Mariprofundus erugo]|uniref:phospholipase D-like domain-containing protein n=1 Tax=Mariprofundus erugo TaxID=2528639 RepID=UPI001930E715|nr:phospholipase D-like domain-containing protein [Mariprofundus erugo]